MYRDFSSMLQRFQGHAVSVVTYSRSRLLGTLADIADDCIRLTGVVLQDELETGGWSDRYMVDDLLENKGNQWPEIIVQRTHISTVTLMDDADVPEVEGEDRVSLLPSMTCSAIIQQATSTVDTDLSDEVQHASLDAAPVVLELGASLLGLLRQPEGQGRPLKMRLSSLRMQLEERVGFLLDAISVRSSLWIQNDLFKISVHGATIKQGTIHPEMMLAIQPLGNTVEIPGISTVEPAFGLASRWIDRQDQREAELAGWTVVDSCSVITTCVDACLIKHLAELLTYDSVSAAVERLRLSHPTTVATLVPHPVSLSVLFEVLRLLVAEGVVIRHLLPILESIARHVAHTDSAEMLVSRVRLDIPRFLSQPYLTSANKLPVVCVEANALQLLIPSNSSRQTFHNEVPIEEARLLTEIRRMWSAVDRAESVGPVLLVDDEYRRAMWKLCRSSLEGVAVFSPGELAGNLKVEILGTITAMFLETDVSSDTSASEVCIDSMPQKPR